MFFLPKKGQGLVEYALVLVLDVIVVILFLALLGPAIGKILNDVFTAI
jgi:pilus assembly protein Flp/PilA